MSKVVLSGYFGFNNLGDEAVLYSMVRGIRKELGEDTDITVLSNSPDATAKWLEVKAVNRWQPLAALSALRSCDVLVSGGGSLLQDVTGAKSLYYYLGVIGLAKMLGKKVMIFAQGMGPLMRNSSRRSAARMLNMADVITVRDVASRHLLREIGVSRPVTITADPVLVLGTDDVPGGFAVTGVSLPENYILVCPRRWRDDAYLAELVKALAQLQRQGRKVVLFPFHQPEDTAVCRDIAAKLPTGAIVLERSMTMEDTISVFDGAELVIGLRLHSLIFAAVAGTPMVGISYDPKVDAFLKRVNQPCCGAAEELSAEALVDISTDILAKPDGYRRQLEQSREVLARAAVHNYHLLAALLD